jgi:hypothetical protein
MTDQERRKNPRIEVDFVTVEIYREMPFVTELAEICPVVNISKAGMRFKSDMKFTPVQLLRLTFVLPESMVIIRTNAVIVHFSDMDKGLYSYGVQFKNLGITEQTMINHFIQKALYGFSEEAATPESLKD